MIKMIKSLLRRSDDWFLIALAIAMAIIFGIFMWWFVSAVHSWATGIEHPIERGLAYVAIAIVAHAFLSSSERGKDRKD